MASGEWHVSLENTVVVTYSNVLPRVQEPVCIGEGHELWRDAPRLRVVRLTAVEVPFEEEVDETIFLERVVGRVLDSSEETLQDVGVAWGIKDVGVFDAAEGEQDIKYEDVGHGCAPLFDAAYHVGGPWECGGRDVEEGD